jgi:hypothetical protein
LLYLYFIVISVLAPEQWFLLILKSKFADGQYIASRLSKSISKTTSKLKALLTEYNSFNIFSLNWKDITDLSSHVWYEGVHCGCSFATIPNSVKLKAIELYHTMLRCDEETSALCKEMKQTVEFFVNDIIVLNQQIDKIKNEMYSLTAYDKGCLLMLYKTCFDIEAKVINLKQHFSDYADIIVPYDSFHYHSSLSALSNSCSATDNVFSQPETTLSVNYLVTGTTVFSIL